MHEYYLARYVAARKYQRMEARNCNPKGGTGTEDLGGRIAVVVLPKGRSRLAVQQLQANLGIQGGLEDTLMPPLVPGLGVGLQAIGALQTLLLTGLHKQLDLRLLLHPGHVQHRHCLSRGSLLGQPGPLGRARRFPAT